MKLLDGKTGIIFGVANKRSIAWAIAQSLSAAGMRLAFTYQGDRLKENVAELAGTLPKSLLYPCDVTSDTEIAGVFEALGRETGPVNTLAARGIRGFTEILKHHAEKAPLKRNVELREVGDTALFLASPLSSGITGEVIYVDCGYHIMAV